MIGIVLVSHSAMLAVGVRELMVQMVQDRVAIAAAGGTTVPEAPIGTDPIAVLEAIEAVYSTDGVLVLMDLGSAMMSAEAALDMLAPEQQAHIYLCEAPLVEGAVAAAVQAAAGGPIEAVFAEARSALAAKSAHLAPLLRLPLPTVVAPELPLDDAEALTDGEVATLTLAVPNRLGLHARPAARLVTLSGQYDAQITLTCQGHTVSATSMNQVATLGARQGDILTIRATGTDAVAALAAIEALIVDNFGDPLEAMAASDREALAPLPPDGDARAGVAASTGIAIGPVAIFRQSMPEIVEQTVLDTAGEHRRLKEAVAAVAANLQQLRIAMAQRVGAGEAGIFDAHLLMLQDADLQQAAIQEIDQRYVNAEAAWQTVIQAVAARYRALEDSYLARRADDLLDVGQRVLRQLMGIDAEGGQVTLAEPSIVVAHDLKPSDVARLPANLVIGIVTEAGGANGHSAILARAMAIPAVTGVGAVVGQLVDGQILALDGDAGRIWLAPESDVVDELMRRQAAWREAQSTARQIARQPAQLRDGRRIEVAANINVPSDVATALTYGAEGVGLFRTEYLFMDRPAPPTEAEQLAAYLEVTRNLDGRPLIVRTLDVGGDKPLAYLPVGHEPNPFLGQRGLRFCLEHPGIFKPQLRAILRAAAEYPVKLMFPMVSTLDELVLADALVAEACAELQDEALPFDDDIQTGIMIEVPSAVLAADQLARFVDFFSIGTNDLAQYVMAADRGNPSVARLISPFQPAVVRAIRQVALAGHAAGIWVGLCGELASDPRATPLLIGLGIDELSMNAPAIPAVKACVRELDAIQAAKIAEMSLLMNTVDEIESYLATLE